MTVALDSLYCGRPKWENISKFSHDLDFDPTMPNVELIRGIFISCNILEFQDPHTHARTHTQTHTHGDEYSLLAV